MKNEPKEMCELCGKEEALFHCENGNCNAACCGDCFGQNYCIKHVDQEI